MFSECIGGNLTPVTVMKVQKAAHACTSQPILQVSLSAASFILLDLFDSIVHVLGSSNTLLYRQRQ